MDSDNISIDYKPGEVVSRFHRDITSRAKLLIGPFRTSKTTGAAWDIVMGMASRINPIKGIKKSRFAVIRNTYPELRDTTIKTYLDWFPPSAFGKYNSVKNSYNLKIDDKEIEILFKALDSPQDVRDLLSLDISGAHIDEAREIHEDVFKFLLGRVGQYPSRRYFPEGVSAFISSPQILLTTNYPSTEHWLYKNFVGNPVSGYSMYEVPQLENLHNLNDPDYYKHLEEDYSDRPDLLRTLIRGQWGVTVRGKIVYPEFDRNIHVAKERLKHLDDVVVCRGWDNTGLSPACVITQIGPTGQLLVLKEFCGSDIGIQDFGEMVTTWCNSTFGTKAKYRDIGDPAGKNRDSAKMSPALYLRKMGINIEDGIQTFKTRRESVANLLNKSINRQPAILIDPWCIRIIDGFEGGYAYGEIGNSGVFKSEPLKNEYSHINDSIQYLCSRLFLRKQEKSASVRNILNSRHQVGWMG